MKKITKILSVIMAAVMLMAALCVPASAADEYASAKLINSGSKVSFQLKATDYLNDGRIAANAGIPKYFKVKLSKNGTLKLDIISAVSNIAVQILDEDGAEMFEYSDKNVTSGGVGQYSNGTNVGWDQNIRKAKSTINYTLKKGVYYIKIFATGFATIDGKTSVTFSYPQDKEESSDSASITSFTITLKKGDKLQLGTILSGDSTVTWSTSKKAVATVTTKGKVTAKGAGTAVITAKTGSSSMKITIKVTE